MCHQPSIIVGAGLAPALIDSAGNSGVVCKLRNNARTVEWCENGGTVRGKGSGAETVQQ